MMFRKPPQSVKVGGVRYHINPDYRIFAQFESDALRGKVNVMRTLSAFYRGSLPTDIDAAAERFVWFYQGGKKPEEDEKRCDAVRSYDFAQDADALYQSFMQAYHIDLYTVRLHWWKFCQLIVGLPENTPFRMLTYIRTADVSKMDKKRRTEILVLRAKYALEEDGKPQTAADYEADMIARLRRAKEAAVKS